MERLTYVTEKFDVLFHPEDLSDDEGMTITQLAEDGRFKALEEIAERLANREDAEELGVYGGKWIPVSERLPEDGIDVLVYFEYYRYGNYNRLFQTMGISYTYNGEWSGFVNDQSGWNQLRIIAWMPLPEPYRENT